MLNSKVLKMAFLTSLMLAIVVSVAIAADDDSNRSERGMGQRGMQGGPGGPGGPGGGFDREAMQERMMSMMQERMGASDQEWTVIKPRLSKVMELSRSTRGGGMRGMMGGPGGRGRGGRGGRNDQDQAQNQQEKSAVEKASEALQETLEKESPSTDEIKAKLTALRSAREKAKAELLTAQKSLREVLSLKQEAQLVMMGMLD